MQAITPRISPVLLPFEKESSLELRKKILAQSPVSEACFSLLFESFLGQLFPYQGFLLLDDAGQLLQSTPKARELCCSIELTPKHQAIQHQMAFGCLFAVPQKVSNLCKFLVDSRFEFPGKILQLSDDIFLDNGLRIHIYAEWVSVAEQPTPCVLVRLEDVSQIAGQRALYDSYRYGFTHRENEVWALYLQGLSHRQISERLFIAICTVKKHMKSIYSKRRSETF